jgi:hypothetical protein
MTGESAGFSPLRNPAGAEANLIVRLDDARAVADQAAGGDLPK